MKETDLDDPRMFVKTLRRAAELVEQGWCQGAWACNDRYVEVASNSPEAVAWCAAGAFERAAQEIGSTDFLMWMQDDGADVMEALIDQNDEPGMTGTRFATAFRREADRLEANAV